MVKYYTKAKFGSQRTIFTPFNKKSTAVRDARLTKRNEGSRVSIRVVKKTPALQKRLVKKYGAYVYR